jgi:hypothetical protein
MAVGTASIRADADVCARQSPVGDGRDIRSETRRAGLRIASACSCRRSMSTAHSMAARMLIPARTEPVAPARAMGTRRAHAVTVVRRSPIANLVHAAFRGGATSITGVPRVLLRPSPAAARRSRPRVCGMAMDRPVPGGRTDRYGAWPVFYQQAPGEIVVSTSLAGSGSV